MIAAAASAPAPFADPKHMNKPDPVLMTKARLYLNKKHTIVFVRRCQEKDKIISDLHTKK